MLIRDNDNNIETLFQHEDYDWLTLVTCETFIPRLEKFTHRCMVRAVLVSMIAE